MLKIVNYSKQYENGKLAVNNLSLNVEKGDIYAFIGHNGAGKTTTIKSIVGILPYTDGEIIINGFNVKNNPIECKKIVAYIRERYTIDQEFAILRQRDTKPEEFAEYDKYCEECKARAKH